MPEQVTEASGESIDQYALQEELLAVFERYGLSVGVGITRAGVALRSQDTRVDAENIGKIKVF